MPGTYSNILLHIVFSTKGRAPLITPDLRPRLYKFMGGIVRSEKGSLLEIGGIADHVHMFLRWRTDDSVSNLMRNVKSRSSKWVNQEKLINRRFSWQESYSVFSVSKSQSDRVAGYIRRQEAHHKKQPFKEELIAMLDANDVEYDPRYIFD